MSEFEGRAEKALVAEKVEVVPVVVGALGCITKGFSGWMDILGIKLNVGMVQKSVLLGTLRILRKVLDM